MCKTSREILAVKFYELQALPAVLWAKYSGGR
jgi:hypothetical protein